MPYVLKVTGSPGASKVHSDPQQKEQLSGRAQMALNLRAP
eukprot:COSAG05_NODE_18274_length_311_cov_0.490566_1_plen_39_part_10